jgi:hypothetical protein
MRPEKFNGTFKEPSGTWSLFVARIKGDMKVIFILCCLASLGACSSSEKKEPNVHPAVLEADIYFIDNGMPMREVKKEQEFFFKKCNVDNRGSYPSKTNYNCNEQ